jgi:hypothetical protein
MGNKKTCEKPPASSPKTKRIVVPSILIPITTDAAAATTTEEITTPVPQNSFLDTNNTAAALSTAAALAAASTDETTPHEFWMMSEKSQVSVLNQTHADIVKNMSNIEIINDLVDYIDISLTELESRNKLSKLMIQIQNIRTIAGSIYMQVIKDEVFPL